MSYDNENRSAERVQKILARAGIASRRNCEKLITEGSVTINGKVAQLGDKAIPGKDAIKVNGKLLQKADEPIYLAFYKPRAVISMLVDNENRPNLSDYLIRLKLKTRVFPVGRLDFNSEGLILLTNDGDFAEKLQKHDEIPRIYTVKVKGEAGDEAIRNLMKGARMDFKMVRPHTVRKLRDLENKTQLQIVIQGGGAIDIRGLCELKGLLVDKIIRTGIGHITTRGIMPGQFKMLKASQVEQLFESPELGLQNLEREIEAEKPKGQRNYHAKKAGADPLSAEGAAPAVKPLSKPTAKSPAKPFAKPSRPSPVKPLSQPAARRGGARPFGAASGSSRDERRPTRRPGAAPKNASGGARSGGGTGYGIFRPGKR